MTYVRKASFAKGELDPALRDKTDTQAYYEGLTTALNVHLTKTGAIRNAAGTWFTALTKDNTDVRIFISTQPQESVIPAQPEYRNYLLEFGEEYVRGYNIIEPVQNAIEGQLKGFQLELFDEADTLYQLEDLPKLKFQNFREKDSAVDVVYIACEGYRLQRLTVVNDVIDLVGTGTYNGVGYEYPLTVNNSAGSCLYTDKVRNNAAVDAMLGHFVEYGFTVVTADGIESIIRSVDVYNNVGNTALTDYPKLPTNDESNSFYISGITMYDTVSPNAPVVGFPAKIRYINVYRRPITPTTGRPSGRRSNNNSWGLIGQADTNGGYTSGTTFSFGFIDFGQEADYTNPPPQGFTQVIEKIEDSTSPFDTTNAGTIVSSFKKFLVNGISSYNNRLLMWKDNLLTFSKINFPRSLLRDFPLTRATALVLEVGQKMPTIFHAVESSGLYVFTSEGIYFGGAIDPVSGLNPILKWINESVIDKDLEPIVTPFGMLFSDTATNTIKTLAYDDVTKSIVADDISTLSNHLFYGKKIVSWAFQGGEMPFLDCILDDGTKLSYHFNRSTGLNGWTRHETDGLYKSVISYKSWDTSMSHLVYVVLRNGNYCIERSSIRILKDPQDFRAFSHSSVLYYMTYEINNPPIFTNESAGTWTVVAGDDTLWENEVKITAFVGQYLVDRIGRTFAVWVPSTETYYYMDLNDATVSGDAVFTITGAAYPEELRGESVKLIECHTVIDGLDHLEGKDVSVVSDNELVGSPNNEKLSLPTYTVTGGEITIPNARAYSVVGLPYVSDIQTLEIDTKGGTTTLDYKLVNKVAVNYSKTRGGYVGGILPTDNSLEDMEYNEEWEIVDIVNRPLAEKTGLKFYTAVNTWLQKGKMSIRQVDPLPLEITSIKLDVSKG